jgi:hypothetical protein
MTGSDFGLHGSIGAGKHRRPPPPGTLPLGQAPPVARRKDFHHFRKQKQNWWEGKSKYFEGKSNILVSTN